MLFPDAYVLGVHLTRGGTHAIVDGVEITMRQLAQRVRSLPGYQQGMTVVLVGCRAEFRYRLTIHDLY